MLPSSTLFIRIDCPFFKRGRCERPYCHYKHDHEAERALDHVAPLGNVEMEKTKVRTLKSTPRNQSTPQELQVKAADLSELEKINKAIEMVKSEVEQEQKKLSRYKTIKRKSSFVASPTLEDYAEVKVHVIEAEGKKIGQCRNEKISTVATKTKYVVDKSKPATDLEYDPLSNYSADLGYSSGKQCDLEIKGVKRVKKDEVKGKAISKCKVSKQEMEGEDSDTLIIDIPPLNEKRSHAPKRRKNGDCDAGLHGTTEQKGLSPSLCVESKAVPKSSFLPIISKEESECQLLEKLDVEEFFEWSETESCVVDSLLGSSAESMTGSFGEDPNVAGCGTLVTTPSNAAFRTTNKSLSLKAKSEKVTGETEKRVMKDELEMEVSLLTEESLGLPVQEEAWFDETSALECTSTSSDQRDSPSVETEQNGKSDSESEANDSDMELDLSDTDPMEECYRIFMESSEMKLEDNALNQETNAHAENEFNADQRELERKETLLPGQKKRVAHVSKYNVKSNRQQIIVPFRGPMSHVGNPTRIQQLQHKATVLTAAVKGGQAFIAASNNQRKIVASPHPPVLPNTGQIVCLNMVQVPALAVSPWGANMQVVIPESTVTNGLTSVPATPSAHRTTFTPAKAVSSRRKTKAVVSTSKVPHDVRQRYVNCFVEEFLKTSSTVQEAFEKALNEEKAVFDRSSNKMKYLSIAVNALKKIKNQTSCLSEDLQMSRGETSVGDAGGFIDSTWTSFYEQLKEHVLSWEMLRDGGFPVQHPEKPGNAICCKEPKKTVHDAFKRICCRCGATYSVTTCGKHVRKEECTYHSGRVLKRKVPGGIDCRYSCCEGAVGTPGCETFQFHVHDGQRDNVGGFVKTFSKPVPNNGNPGVFAVDCEMCYTTQGLELARVTVVNPGLQVVYDTFVKTDNEVLDYNTRFSGVTEEDLKQASSTIRDVQAVLLNLFSAETILIGHSFENDLFALKLLHSTVVDTSIVFPHRLGLPNKRALRTLMAEYLRRIIQENVGGHDSSEDATACMELMLWKVKEDTKGKRW
ncbi:REXO1 exonuclease, partial [Polypterus senegalus]|nr:RNA exonuclease 1 homolog [Polypterus senegalus]MBN3290206.1 REXO1 exonuclease [Polypterus senegalus]